jgi:hypothetical protein
MKDSVCTIMEWMVLQERLTNTPLQNNTANPQLCHAQDATELELFPPAEVKERW